MRLGADPEVFLVDQTGKHISAIGYINADKWHPLQIEGMPEGFTLQEDNVSLEYGIPPASSADEFVAHIQAVMARSLDWLPNLSFSKLSCTVFAEDQMQHPLAHVFGCEPDYDAWSKKENRKPEPPHPFMRSAGGHIHVETKQDPVDVVRKMDAYLAIPAMFMDVKGYERQKLYGKKGAHRVKSYGVEYRVLSNFWIAPGGTEAEREKLGKWVWRNTERALNSSVNIEEYGDYLEIAINNNDKAMAHALVNELNLEVL